MPSRHDPIAERLHTAIEAGDLAAVRDCYAPDVELWMNIDRTPNGLEGAMSILEGFVAITDERRYEVTRREDTPTGYVQEHLLHVTGTNGVEATSAACLVVEVDEATGRITAIHEYLDSRALAPVFG